MLGTLRCPINSKWERVFDDFVAVDAQVMTEKEADVAGAAQAIHENATIGCLVVVLYADDPAGFSPAGPWALTHRDQLRTRPRASGVAFRQKRPGRFPRNDPLCGAFCSRCRHIRLAILAANKG
jgi:hypothetical protein